MTTYTKNTKIFEFIVFPILVYMMNFQIFFFFLTAKIAFFRQVTKSYFAIFCLMCISTSFLTITTIKRTIFFFEMFCSRFWKSKFLSANFTISSYRKHQTNSFMRTLCRTTSSLILFKDFRGAKEFFFTNRASYFNFFSPKLILTFLGTKKILMFFYFPLLCFEKYIAERAFDFHIRHNSTQEVLCQ